MNFTTIDRILSKHHREMKNNQVSERDLIEWAGEALDFMKVYEIQEQAVAFLMVENWEADIPANFQMILQVAKNNFWTEDINDRCACMEVLNEDLSGEDNFITPVPLDCQGNIIDNINVAYFRPYWSEAWDYTSFIGSNTYRKHFTPIRLASNTFFNSIVCSEKQEVPYCDGCNDSYTIVGGVDKKLRFSFKDGFIALSYVRTMLDKETGLPLIPDDITFISAIEYYIKWKIKESDLFDNRDGAAGTVQYFEQRWLKYVRQAKNYAMMPKSIDDYQDLMEQSHNMIPRTDRYYSYFGNLNSMGTLKYRR